MPHVLYARRQYMAGDSGPAAVAVAGQLEPVEPAYTKPPKPSPVYAHLGIPSEAVNKRAPVVNHAQNTRGMRYLYAHGGVRQPLSAVGVPGKQIGIAVWRSIFQPILVSMHDAGFNDRLFQAGYPGFNLGLSFKVPTLQENATGGPGYNMHMNARPRFTKVQVLRRVNASPGQYPTTSVNGGGGK